MDLLDLLVLLVECIVVGFGMAVGDWVVKVIAVRLLNSEQAALHDVEEDEPDDDEDRRKRARRPRKPPKPDVRARPGSGAPIGVVP